MRQRPITIDRALALPSSEVANALLALREGQWFDRKSGRIAPRNLADALIGFGNAEGGILVVGLSRGEVEGIESAGKSVEALLQAPIDFTDPPVRARPEFVDCTRADGAADQLLVFTVESSEVVHVNRKDEVYLRVGDENRRLTFVQRRELLYDKGQSTYESEVLSETSRADVDYDLLDSYAEALVHPDPERLMIARGLSATSGRLTIAGCVLFATEPQRYLPHAQVRVIRYRGVERGSGSRQQIVQDERLDGPLPRQLYSAQGLIRDLQPTRRALQADGRFGPVPLVPEDAWLEGIVNAAVHRSYSLTGDHIRVEIFDDRIEISSPGRFPGLVDLTDPLNATRFARNPRIARVCADLNLGQELGEGIRRIYDEMRSAGLHEPRYRQTQASVELTLSAEPMDLALEQRLPRASRVITAALREAGRLSTGEVAEILGNTRPTALRKLRALEAEGLVEWVGKSARDPRAYWRLPAT
jgi:ATP-dependent DNA helicase RecG